MQLQNGTVAKCDFALSERNLPYELSIDSMIWPLPDGDDTENLRLKKHRTLNFHGCKAKKFQGLVVGLGLKFSRFLKSKSEIRGNLNLEIRKSIVKLTS